MKQILILLTIILAFSCNKASHEQGCYVDVINDVTDEHILRPKAQAILELFNLSEDKDASASFSYSEIRDISLVPVTSFSLPDRVTTESRNHKNEPFFREKLILSFYDTIKTTLSSPTNRNDTSSLSHSECFRSVCNELTTLSQDKSARRILIVYSNLFENSTLNLYSPRTQKILFKNPGEIKRLFLEMHLLPDHLDGITIIFVYQPTNRDDDKLYNSIVTIYKSLLQERGARVIVQANNTHFNI